MKKITIACLSLLLFAACTKTQNSGGSTVINPSPPAPDTSTLRKSEIAYFNFDGSGNPKDSALTRWVYDGNRRLVQSISGLYGDNYYDSSFTSYSGNQSVTYNYNFQQTSLLNQSTTTTYFNAHGTPDSIYSIEGNRSSIVIYKYDADGNDTLEASYNIAGAVRTLSSKTTQYYSGGVRQLSLDVDNNGVTITKAIWANGNIIADTVYANGTLTASLVFTYNNIANAGWSYYSFSNNLMTGEQETFYNPLQIAPAETDMYTFDAANRVSTETIVAAGAIKYKDVFVYY